MAIVRGSFGATPRPGTAGSRRRPMTRMTDAQRKLEHYEKTMEVARISESVQADVIRYVGKNDAYVMPFFGLFFLIMGLGAAALIR